MSDAPENGRPPRRKGFYKRQIELEAANQGLTVEEYGVYKGSTGSAIKPINSAGGLLFLAVLSSSGNARPSGFDGPAARHSSSPPAARR